MVFMIGVPYCLLLLSTEFNAARLAYAPTTPEMIERFPQRVDGVELAKKYLLALLPLTESFAKYIDSYSSRLEAIASRLEAIASINMDSCGSQFNSGSNYIGLVDISSL